MSAPSTPWILDESSSQANFGEITFEVLTATLRSTGIKEDEIKHRLAQMIVAELLKKDYMLFTQFADPNTFEKKFTARLCVSKKSGTVKYIATKGTNIQQKT
jgi:hypothetical protein